jgi:sugar lactone lactonase YvrE
MLREGADHQGDTVSPAVRYLDAELLDDAGAVIGEGPTWDAEHGELLWVDIESGLVRRADADGVPIETIAVGVHVGAVLPAQGGGWLLATADGFSFLAPDGSTRRVLDVQADRPELRFNDAKCDPLGRAIAGTMRYDTTPGQGTLYRLDPGPRAEVLLTAQGLCNGIGWSPDGQRMYFVDTLSQRVATYDYDLATGSISGGGQLVTIDPDLGGPDGLCVDDEGGVWVAIHGGGTVHRYQPDGTLDVVVALPVPSVTSVAFGGPRRDRLFITTSGGPGMNHTGDRGSAPLGAGGLWAVEPGLAGPPATPWRPVEGTEVEDTGREDTHLARRDPSAPHEGRAEPRRYDHEGA